MDKVKSLMKQKLESLRVLSFYKHKIQTKGGIDGQGYDVEEMVDSDEATEQEEETMEEAEEDEDNSDSRIRRIRRL